jgi:DNA-binding beta-propeller fold protein YncE
VSDLGADANSVATRGGIVAVAVEAAVRTDPGFVAFYDTEGNRLSVVAAGALPDALTFSPDGRWVLVANEGEPAEDYAIDPEGSVTIIDLAGGAANLTAENVRTADFSAFNGREDELRAAGVRIFGPGASAAQDFEPEWVEVASDNRTAYVSLQENNAIAVVDIETATVTAVWPLGFKG